ncbi:MULTISPECIES: LPS assembly lipoprotein LptE [unclassified Duganella]|uniref:LPS-assembly lipoprotein LptE n=1 Tax=unclassified Duganella TaxID=2636909 RepID=UPI000883E46E|nr:MULTISPECIES: LPS assembly lipoprotein LptE [unclassified Duganella]SDG16532.1 LPS-assembly lipoprotein [Duganella sp. OV458]SDJ31402.1 LPS-assembly lipoprotein [Duganella sp. OV510]
MATTSKFLCAALLATSLTLSGCGFHLRGDGGHYTLPFPTIYVGLPEASPLAIDLKRNIRANGGTTVVSSPKEADGVVEVLSNPEKTKTKTILSLNSNGRVRQYLLTYNIIFRIVDKQGKELLAPTQITLTRPIDFNETQLLAKEQEEALLYKDMQTDLVQQMMRRIAAVKTAGVSLPPPGAAPLPADKQPSAQPSTIPPAVPIQ